MRIPFGPWSFCILIAASLWWVGCSRESSSTAKTGALVVYSGRSEDLIGPVLARYQAISGVEVQVRYGGSTEMAATLLEEGPNSPADVFISQDAGALGSLAGRDLLAPLPKDVLDRVPASFRSPDGRWVGLSGRARVVVVNRNRVSPDDLPDDVFGFTDPKWRDRLGWAPANASFQSFVTALRAAEGEERARAWLLGIQANNPKVYAKNTAIVAAVAAGEIDAGFSNHYYLHTMSKQGLPVASASNSYLRAGTLINVSGAGVLASSRRTEAAADVLRFLLSPETQGHFAEATFEYPLAGAAGRAPELPPLSDLRATDMDLNRLDDLQGTLRLLQDLNIL